MTPFECVPNFSEGRDAKKVAQIAGAARAVAGVTVLDVESNADHNRSVVTLYGEGEPLLDAVFRMMAVATVRVVVESLLRLCCRLSRCLSRVHRTQ